jgi:DNA primase
MIDASTIAAARAVPIVNEITRRNIVLRRVGAELVGGCPVCGDGGKGIRSNRLAVHLHKNVWLCRQCRTGGDVIALVQHLDGVGFTEAVEMLADEPSTMPRHASAVRETAPSTDAAHIADGRHRALDLWGRAAPIAGTLAQRYLIETRRLVLPRTSRRGRCASIVIARSAKAFGIPA